VTEPNRNFLFGGAWFPQRNTVGVQVAYHLALRDIPAGDLKAQSLAARPFSIAGGSTASALDCSSRRTFSRKYSCRSSSHEGSQASQESSVEGPVPANVAIVQPPPPAPPLPPGASVLCGRTAGGFFGNTPQGFLDFALIDLSGRIGVSSALDDVPGNGPVLGTAFIVNNNLTATEFGAMTGRTSGIFAGIVPSVTVDGIAVTNVFEFVGAPGTPFGQRGDSGSLVISSSSGSTGGLIGLLFAVTPATPDAPSGRGFVVPFDRIPGVRPV